MGPLFTYAAAATDAQLRVQPQAEMDGDAAILGRSRVVTLVAILIAIVLFGGMAFFVTTL